MTARGKFFVTPHAVKQYLARYCEDGASYEQGLDELISKTSEARFVAYSKRGDGSEIWETKRLGKKASEHRTSRMRFVVGYDNPGLPQVRTILPRAPALTRVLAPGETAPNASKCEVCGALFIGGRHGPQRVCAVAACSRELNRRRCAAWYQVNRERHLANVKAREVAAE